MEAIYEDVPNEFIFQVKLFFLFFSHGSTKISYCLFNIYLTKNYGLFM